MFRRILIYGGLTLGGLLAVALLGGMIAIYSLTRDMPSVETLQNYQPPVTTRVYAGNGTVLGEYARERRIFVPISFVPKQVINAFTSAEDKNFFSHPGVDPSGILRAAGKDIINVLEHKRLEGASTITQQVAKNFLLNSEQKFSRKIREAILAVRIDATYSKQKILELYLNEIFLGENSYGVESAALNYFGKSLDQLDIAECAFLAALPKAPSNYDPRYNKQAALDRRNWVIGQMADNGYITRDEEKASIAEPLVTQTRPLGSQAEDADYFVEEVRRLLDNKYGQNALYDGGLQVRATLDTRLQNYAVSALRTGLVRYDRRHGWRGAVSNISTTGDWKDALASAGNQSGIDTWRVAVVLGYGDDRSVDIGLENGQHGSIPFSELQWRGLRDQGERFGRCCARDGAAGRARRRRDLCRADGHQGRFRPASGARSERRHRRDGSAYGPRAGDVGRLLLRLQPVRPRDAGQSPARFVVQAVCLCGCARQRLHAGEQDPRRTGVAAARSRLADVDAEELREAFPRSRHLAPRHRAVAQPDDDPHRRRGGHGQGRPVSDPLRRLRQAAGLSLELHRRPTRRR